MKKKIFLFNADYTLLIGYVIAFVLLLTSYFLTLYSNKDLKEQTRSVTHSYKIINDVETLLSLVKDGETGVRGYVNTKDTVFLEPYYKSIPAVASMLSLVKQEIKSDPTQLQNLRNLTRLTSKRYEHLKKGMDVFVSNGYQVTDSMMKNPYGGKLIMDSLRLLVKSIQDYENKVLTITTEKVASRYLALNIIVITSLLLAFIFAAFGVVTFVRENKARYAANQKIIAYQQDLRARIVELDNANKKLQEMRREEKFASTGRIARIIAHEVRNPLTNIDLAMSQIREDSKGNEDAEFLFDVVSRNSNRINQLITELLNATRVTELSFKIESIHNVLEEALELARDRIELNNVILQKKFTGNPCNVSIDPPKIKIALLNLIINAIESMKDSPEKILTIITSVENEKAVVEISDTGIGMDSTALGRLFEAYYTTKPKGNGLGLTNTQNIILNHNGSIDVESNPDMGSRFTIRFNLA